VRFKLILLIEFKKDFFNHYPQLGATSTKENCRIFFIHWVIIFNE